MNLEKEIKCLIGSLELLKEQAEKRQLPNLTRKLKAASNLFSLFWLKNRQWLTSEQVQKLQATETDAQNAEEITETQKEGA